MRILLDECGYGWDDAFAMVQKICAYTNHTVMSEALECWSEELFERLLPIEQLPYRECRHTDETPVLHHEQLVLSRQPPAENRRKRFPFPVDDVPGGRVLVVVHLGADYIGQPVAFR